LGRQTLNLSQLAVQKLKRPGRHPVGCNLYLRISPSGSRSWVFRYMAKGSEHEMGLGPVDLVSLAEARLRTLELRKARLHGVDPLEAKRLAAKTAAAPAAKGLTFEACAAAYIDSHSAGWKNPKHAVQWTTTLEQYAYPGLGKLPVQDIDTSLVMNVLQPIWTRIPETAGRVRGRIVTSHITEPTLVPHIGAHLVGGSC
jgi:hypothetical protein